MPIYAAKFTNESGVERSVTYPAANYAHAAVKASWLTYTLEAKPSVRITLTELPPMWVKLQAHHDAQEGMPCLELAEDSLYCDVYIACRKLAKGFGGWSEDELNLLPQRGEAI